MIERARIGEVLLDFGHELALVEVARGVHRLVGDDFARQHVRGAHPLDTFLHEHVVRIADAFAGFDQEIDDLGQRHVEERRHFGAGVDHAVEIEFRRCEAHAQIAGAVDHVLPFDQFAAQEEGCGNSGFGLVHHATPRT